jgi:hypothetical protein
MQKFHIERSDVKKLNNVEVEKEYQFKLSNRFAALQNFNVNMNINRAWEIMSNCCINHNFTKNAQVYQMKGMVCRG